MLPIETVSEQVLSSLIQRNVVLVAPPGAGKSTFLPLQLLKSQHFSTQKIIMLQPRKVAVRAIAEHLAEQLNEKVGETVGYRFRGEARVSANTRLEIVTEGLLTRMLQRDPELSGVGLILFDEFHERSVHADLSLAFSIEAQQSLREDLRLLVMSATLDVEPLMKLFDDAVLVECEGRSFPVDTHYNPVNRQADLAQAVSAQIVSAANEESGNILAFLPGAREIQRVQQLLAGKLSPDIQVLPLYGALDKKQQIKAIAPTASNERKIVLATNIAETSLTIEGIRVVIDSGIEKVARYDLSKGVNRLQQQAISEASSIQRQGRAGRLGPGVCYRLWDKEKQSRLARQIPPEILHTDVSPVLLEIACWGAEVGSLPLLDQPTGAQISHALALLSDLDALDAQQKITSHGKEMAKLGCHPRLAHMLLKAKSMSDEKAFVACMLCAVLEFQGRTDAGLGVSLHSQLEKMLSSRQDERWKATKQWQKRLRLADESKPGFIEAADVALLTGLGYPDFIAKHMGKNRYLLSNGSGASLADDDPLRGTTWLAIGQMHLGSAANAIITCAEAIDESQLKSTFARMFKQIEYSDWDGNDEKIITETRYYFGEILLASQPAQHTSEQERVRLWSRLINDNGLNWLNWPDSVTNLLQRLRLTRQFSKEKWPDFSEEWLLKNLQSWCGFELAKVKSRKQLQQIDWQQLLLNLIDWPQQQLLDDVLPKHFVAPTGNRHKFEYHYDGSVNLSIRLQELYGLNETPSVANGRLPVTLKLLSPAQRPIQQTADLKGFWLGSYKDVQKEMKGRYPKHFWPDDPANAKATTKTKKNM